MLRTLFVLAMIALGTVCALRRPFYALLFYLWVAYFRPESWVWFNFISNLSLIVGAYLVFAAVVSKDKFKFDWRIGLLALFLLQSLVSTLASPYFDKAWPWWQDFAKAIVVTYLLIVLTNDRSRLRMAMLAIALSLGFEAAKQGWIQLILRPGGINTNEIPFLGDNNGVAVGVLMLVPVFLALARTTDRRWERWLHYFLAAGTAYRGIITYSRGGFLACGVLIAVYIIHSRARLRTIAGIALIAAIVLPALPDAFWDRMNTMTTKEDKMDDSAASRIHFWRVAVAMANDHPLTGVGHNSYNSAFDRYDFLDGRYGRGRSVHSTWFGVLAELGYGGLAVYLAILALAVLACHRVIRQTAGRADQSDLQQFAIAIETSLAVFAVGGSFVPSQYVEMSWHFIGLSTALRFIALERPAAADATQPVPARSPSPAFSRGTPIAVAPAAWRTR